MNRSSHFVAHRFLPCIPITLLLLSQGQGTLAQEPITDWRSVPGQHLCAGLASLFRPLQ